MEPFWRNVSEFVFEGRCRGQVATLDGAVAVTAAHFLDLEAPNDVITLPEMPEELVGAVELARDPAPPKVGDPVMIAWEDGGFKSIHRVRVSRVEPDGTFAVGLGFVRPEDVRGCSGAIVWNPQTRASAGVMVGVQQVGRTTHGWVHGASNT